MLGDTTNRNITRVESEKKILAHFLQKGENI
jgi:hypothetical protein